jgi:hypothetical protein
MGTPTPDKLTTLAEAAAAGTLRVDVRSFPLEDAPVTLAAFMGGTLGKLVLTVG